LIPYGIIILHKATSINIKFPFGNKGCNRSYNVINDTVRYQ